MSCTTDEENPHQADCSIASSGVIGQENCLACESEIVQTVLHHTDFTLDGQVCDLDGWTLATGEICADRIVNCVPYPDSFGDWVDCRDDFSAICAIEDDHGVLSTGMEPAPVKREWMLFRSFDTRGYRDLDMCFDVYEQNADENDWLVLTARDQAHQVGENFMCLNNGPGIDDNHRWYRICRRLPDWAGDNESVRIIFTGHSHQMNQYYKLKNVTLRGFSNLCPRGVWIVDTEDFAGCTDPLPADWNGWQVDGVARCGGFSRCYDEIPEYLGTSIEAENQSVVLSKHMDVSILDERVTVCFRYGSTFVTSADFLEFFYDTGSGWVSAYKDNGLMGMATGICRKVCVNISDLDPQANNHPDLGIRFHLNSTSILNRIDLADIRLHGHLNCSGDDHLIINPSVEQGDAIYTFIVANDTNQALSTEIQCEWDSTDPPTQGASVVHLGPK